MHDENLINKVARAIYKTHWKEGLPRWEFLTQDFRDYVLKQAVSALDAIEDKT